MCTRSVAQNPSRSNVAYLIGDRENFLRNSLLGLSEEQDSNLKGNVPGDLVLNTKYYSCSVSLKSFPSVSQAEKWNRQHHDEEVAALVLSFEDGFLGLPHIKEALSIWDVQTWVVVCDRLKEDSDCADELKRLCFSKGIEIVELDPEPETIAELNECHEKYGVARLIQVLEATDWPFRVFTRLSAERGELQKKLNMISHQVSCGDCEYGDFQSGLVHPQSVTGMQGHLACNQNGISLGDGFDCTNSGANPKSELSTSKAGIERLRDNTDELVEDMDEMLEKFSELRARLTEMPFGPARQNFAADAMMQMVEILGKDILDDSSEDES